MDSLQPTVDSGAAQPAVIPDDQVQLDPQSAQLSQQPAFAHDNQPQSQAPAIPDDQVELDSDKYGTPEQKVKTAIEGGARGFLGPIPDYLSKNLGVAKEQDILGRMKTNSILSTGTEVGGLVGSALLGTGMGSAMEHAGQAAEALTEAGRATQAASNTAKALGLSGSEAAKTVKFMTQDIPAAAKIGASTLKGATEMAIMSGSDELSKEVLNDPDTSASTALSNIGLNAVLGGATGALFTGAINPLWNATLGPKLEAVLGSSVDGISESMKSATPDSTLRPILRKVLSTFGGVAEEDIDGYLAHHEAIATAPEFEDVYQHTLDHIGKLNDDLEAGKISVSSAKSGFDDYRKEIMQTFQERGADARSAAQLADHALADAQTKLASDIEQRAMDTGYTITGAMENLRQKVVDGSKGAYDILQKADQYYIPTKSLLDKAEELAQHLDAQSTIESRNQAAKIREYASNIANKYQSGKITGPGAKTMIQGLDAISKYNYGASNFDNGLAAAYKQLRGHLDDVLKTAVPEYKTAMKGVAKDTGLLSNLSKYGEEASSIRGVRGLRNPANYKIEMPLLKQLEDTTGTKFLHDIEPYANKDLQDKLMKSMPEYSKAQQTAADLQNLKDRGTKAKMVEEINNSEAAKAVENAQNQQLQAQTARNQVKGVTEANLQSSLKGVNAPGKRIALEEVLSRIPGMEGKSIPEIMNLLRLKEAFDKNATRGSKHVNLFGGMMGALFKALTLSGFEGFGVGAMAGAAVDNFGPAGVKKVLDKYMEHYGNIEQLAKAKPGAAKVMLGHILGADIPASGQGFKAGVDMISNQIKGNDAMKNSVVNLFKTGTVITPKALTSKMVAQNKQLDDKINKYQDNNGYMLAQQGSLHHYMPNHAAAGQAAIQNQVHYLKQIMPKSFKANPLDTAVEPSQAQKNAYESAKTIANNPTMIMQKIKDGQLKSQDMQDFAALWPKLVPKYQSMITQEVANQQQRGNTIPYKVRTGLSMFLAQPLDSSMIPARIQAAQVSLQPSQPQQGPQQAQGKKQSKGAASKLGKTDSMYKTPVQAAEGDRGDRD